MRPAMITLPHNVDLKAYAQWITWAREKYGYFELQVEELNACKKTFTDKIVYSDA